MLLLGFLAWGVEVEKRKALGILATTSCGIVAHVDYARYKEIMRR